MSSIEVFPFGDELVARDPAERFNEEVYRSMPALDELAQSSLRVGNRLSSDARHALFFGTENGMADVRSLKVEVAMLQRQHIETVAPDMQFFAGLAAQKRKDFETADNDAWLEPTP